MEQIQGLSKKDVWSHCFGEIKGFLKRSSELQQELGEKDFALRQIDPALLGEARYSDQDYLLIKIVKTIYYMVSAFFYSHQIATLQGEKKEIHEQIKGRGDIEQKVLSAYKRVFAPLNCLKNVPAAISESFEPRTLNAFLEAEELKGTFLETGLRCLLPKEEEGTDTTDSSELEYYSCDDEEFFSFSDDDEEVASSPPPLTVDTLMKPEVKAVLGKIFPLDHVLSITSLGGKNYEIRFSEKLVGKVDRNASKFQTMLEAIIRRELQKGGDLTPLKEAYPTVGTFLNSCSVNTLNDVAGIIYWNYLSEACIAAGQSRCEIDQVVKVRVGKRKIQFLEGNYLAGFFVTDYHLIKNHLFNRMIQGLLFTCLKGLGLVTYGGSTQKPFSSTLSFRTIKVIEGEVCLTLFHEKTKALSFQYDRSWQTPQNFPKGDLKALEQGVTISLDAKIIDFIGHSLKWISF